MTTKVTIIRWRLRVQPASSDTQLPPVMVYFTPAALRGVLRSGCTCCGFRTLIPNNVYHISRDPALLNKVNCPSPCYLWQKTFNVISHPCTPAFPLRCRVCHHWVNRARFPQLDQQAIKVQPLPTNLFSNGPTKVRTGVDQFGREVNRDLSKISKRGCDGLECDGDPLDVP